MKKQISWLYITVFINVLGFGMIFPLFPLFAESLKASFFDIGLLAVAFSAAQFLFSPFTGRISDRFGRKPLLLFSVVISVIAYLILAFAPNLGIVFFSRLLKGISSASNFPIAQAYVADITTKEERTVFMGKISAIYATGFIVGPAFGGLLGAQGFQTVFLVAAAISLLNLIFISLFLPESINKRSEKLVLREGFFNFKAIYQGLRSDFGILFFLLFSWAVYISNFHLAVPLFTEHKFSMGAFENGIFFSATGVAAAVTQWFFLPLVVKKIGELKTIFMGIVLMIVGHILAPLTTLVSLFYLFFIISVAGSGFNRPTVNALLSKRTREGQGTTMGLAFSFESLGRIMGPIAAGLIIQRFGLASPFWLTVGVLLIGLFLFWKVEMKR